MVFNFIFLLYSLFETRDGLSFDAQFVQAVEKDDQRVCLYSAGEVGAKLSAQYHLVMQNGESVYELNALLAS